MSANVQIVEATLSHASRVAAQIRPEDRAEIRAGWGLEPLAAMHECLVASAYARTAFYRSRILGMYGIARPPQLGASGEIWCFGTKAIDDHPVAFLRASRRVLSEMLRDVPILTNVVDVQDERARKWLAFLDARYVLQPRPLGGKLFQQFILAKHGDQQCQQA